MVMEFAVCMTALQATLASKPDNERKSNNGVTNQEAALSAPPLDPIRQETFFADDAHISQRAASAMRQKFFAQPRQRRGVRSAEEIRRDRQIQLIDEIRLE